VVGANRVRAKRPKVRFGIMWQEERAAKRRGFPERPKVRFWGMSSSCERERGGFGTGWEVG